ncbi:hypothetical protein [Streptomyces ortus]|uniref:Lipoprotein n=1 Tax=Streptomyces ortus TaxID=2867268 RepID=A0ABT3V3J9_9ACTN|nr:hypothetical protein [Streptomyces ortus]MCX4233220.1 hypothetical protein [Streptomyces ortus]
MTSLRGQRALGPAATVLVLGLLAGGCGSGGGDEERAVAAPSTPPPTGTGPYPTPSAPATHPPEAAVPEPESTDEPRGGTVLPRDVDRTDADAVSEGALKVLWTFDTTTDSGPHDAEVRAADAGWLTGAYADRLRAQRPRTIPGVQWQEWAEHRAHTTVVPRKTADAAQPPDTDTGAWRQWTVTATPSGRRQWTGEPAVVTVFLHLTRTAGDQPWRVADVTVH